MDERMQEMKAEVKRIDTKLVDMLAARKERMGLSKHEYRLEVILDSDAESQEIRGLITELTIASTQTLFMMFGLGEEK